MDDAQIIALRRKCESLDDGATVITLDKATALAMLRKLDACKTEQARVNTNNVALTAKLAAKARSRDKWAATAWTRKQRGDVCDLRIAELETMHSDAERRTEEAKAHNANLEEQNTRLQTDRDEVDTLRQYLAQEFGRPPYIDVVEEAEGPASYAIAVMNRQGEETAAAKEGRAEDLRKFTGTLNEYGDTLEDLRHGIPRGAVAGDVPQDGKRYRVFFRSRIVEYQQGPNAWIEGDSESGQWYATNCDGWLPEPDTCWSCDRGQDAVEGTGGHCAECVKWIGGGMQPAAIEAGTRVRYYGCFGDDEYRVGQTRSKARKNVNGYWVVHVDLDDKRTIHSAHIRHLAPEVPEVRTELSDYDHDRQEKAKERSRDYPDPEPDE